MRIASLLAMLGLAACGTPQSRIPPDQLSASFRSASDASLCATYSNPRTTLLTKQMIEAELVIRGINQCSGRNYGRATAAASGQQLYTRSELQSVPLAGQDRDCSDFSSGAVAQRFFLHQAGQYQTHMILTVMAMDWLANGAQKYVVRQSIVAPLPLCLDRLAILARAVELTPSQ